MPLKQICMPSGILKTAQSWFSIRTQNVRIRLRDCTCSSTLRILFILIIFYRSRWRWWYSGDDYELFAGDRESEFVYGACRRTQSLGGGGGGQPGNRSTVNGKRPGRTFAKTVGRNSPWNAIGIDFSEITPGPSPTVLHLGGPFDLSCVRPHYKLRYEPATFHMSIHRHYIWVYMSYIYIYEKMGFFFFFILYLILNIITCIPTTVWFEFKIIFIYLLKLKCVSISRTLLPRL